MNQYYDKIMQLREADEIKQIVRRWSVLSDNIKTKPIDIPIILPDMLWVAKSGAGITNLLKLISEYLASRKNLMEFYGDVKFFEFLVSYCPPNQPFVDLHRLIDEVNNAAGFRNEFKGIVHLDINDWVNHYEEKHFVSLMEYLAANSDKWLIVLSAYSEKKDAIHNLHAFLSMYLRVEKVTLSLPRTQDLFEYIEGKLNEYGLTLESDARDLLSDTIEKLRENKYFDGFKSIKMLCQDIAYEVFSNEKINTYSLTADMLSAFSVDSEYVKKMAINSERARRIGLVYEE